MEITDSNYEAIVAEGKPMVVDFWATWCRPCMMMGPVIDELAEEYDGRAIIAKMNVDDAGVGDICARFGITNIPNMKLFKNGVEVGNVVGAVPKATVKGVIDRNL